MRLSNCCSSWIATRTANIQARMDESYGSRIRPTGEGQERAVGRQGTNAIEIARQPPRKCREVKRCVLLCSLGNTGRPLGSLLARISTALLAFILASMVPLHGQDQSLSVDVVGPIATDRPAVTNSSVVVPAGSFQAENTSLKLAAKGRVS